MKVAGTHYRAIWTTASGAVRVIDQSRLPFEFTSVDLGTEEDAAQAIRTMVVRGAPLIGATAAYGLALALRADPSDANLDAAASRLRATRPTAVNLAWALARIRGALAGTPAAVRADAAMREAAAICDAEVERCQAIGRHGLDIIRGLPITGRAVNILTHCNAGWLACIDWGTALAPIYLAHDAGIAVHVWVDETRPRNQGASLTAFELGAHGVPHTVIADNLGGHLMQRGEVDLVIVGSDRVTATGDVCNKVGTYLKALAAHDNGLAFYAAQPSSTIDWTLEAAEGIPIEERPAAELTHVIGRGASGRSESVRVVPESSPVLNLAFDVTPARLVTALITERGVCPASAAGLRDLYGDAGTAAGQGDPPKSETPLGGCATHAPASAPALTPTAALTPAPALTPTTTLAADASDAHLRRVLITACRELARRGLSHGTSGNIGLRCDERRFLVSPTGMAYENLEPEDIPLMDCEGHWYGRRRPSSEWRFHRDIFQARKDVGAIVHTHSRHATALACAGRGIPAFHYMVALAGGCDIRCAPYFSFGTQELSAAAVTALEGRRACLLANHGVIALGADVDAALALAGEVENLAAQYAAALTLGGAVRVLDDEEMRRMVEKFRTYGTQDAVDPGLAFGGAAPAGAGGGLSAPPRSVRS